MDHGLCRVPYMAPALLPRQEPEQILNMETFWLIPPASEMLKRVLAASTHHGGQRHRGVESDAVQAKFIEAWEDLHV